MNLGDGLLFELDNGKPKLILLNRGEKAVKNAKLRPRLPSVLGCRQTPRLDTPQAAERPVKTQDVLNGRSQLSKPGRGRGQTFTSTKTQENHAPRQGAKNIPKLKTDKLQPLRPNRKPEESNKKEGPKAEPSNQSAALQDRVACLTNQQLQQILSVVETNVQAPTTDANPQDCSPESAANETKETSETREGTENASDKDKRSGGLFSWVEQRPSEDRATMDAKKAQWKKELDEQVALKQKQAPAPAPSRLQAEEDRDSVASVQSSIVYKDLPAAIRSSLKIGEFTPMEEAGLTVEKKEEQRRLWLEELDKQREQTSERKRLEKLLHRQTEDHQLWASHFDSLQRQPLVPGPGSDRGGSSSLSQWEGGRDSVDTNSSGPHTNRASHLRTMTSLLDPAQIEERERRRLKQLEQQRAITLQMEERRRRKEEDEAQRRRDEEEEERRLESEREQLQRQYEREALRDTHKEQQETEQDFRNSSELTLQSSTTNQEQRPEQEAGPAAVNHLRDTAVQTEDLQTSECNPNPKTRAQESHSTVPGQVGQVVNVGQRCVNGDVYEAFSRTERNKTDKRPQWNTQRPSRRFVPASQRYPEELQKHRQQSRLHRQAQLLALQKNQAAIIQSNHHPPGQKTHHGDNRETQSNEVETVGPTTERGRSLPHSESPAPDFLPYVRTTEVFNLIPEETRPTHLPHIAPVPPAPQLLQKTQRQQEILRGLAQLKQGLLQKQRELESDLSRGLLDDNPQTVSMATTHRREL